MENTTPNMTLSALKAEITATGEDIADLKKMIKVVDGDIHRAAGPGLSLTPAELEENRPNSGVPITKPKIGIKKSPKRLYPCNLFVDFCIFAAFVNGCIIV